MPVGITKQADQNAFWLLAAENQDAPPQGATPPVAITKSKKFLAPAKKLKTILENIPDDHPGNHSAVPYFLDNTPAFTQTYIKPQYNDMLKAYLGPDLHQKLLKHLGPTHTKSLTVHEQLPAPNSNKFKTPANGLKKLLDGGTSNNKLKAWMEAHPQFVSTYLHNPAYQEAIKGHLGQDTYNYWAKDMGLPGHEEKSPIFTKPKTPEPNDDITEIKKLLEPVHAPDQSAAGEKIAPPVNPLTEAEPGHHHNQYTDPSKLKKNEPKAPGTAQPEQQLTPVEQIQQHLDSGQYVPHQMLLEHISPTSSAGKVFNSPAFKQWYEQYQKDGGQPGNPVQLLNKFHQYKNEVEPADLGYGDEAYTDADDDQAADINEIKVHQQENKGSMLADLKEAYPAQWHESWDNPEGKQQQLEQIIKIHPENEKLKAVYDKWYGQNKGQGRPEGTGFDPEPDDIQKVFTGESPEPDEGDVEANEIKLHQLENGDVPFKAVTLQDFHDNGMGDWDEGFNKNMKGKSPEEQKKILEVWATGKTLQGHSIAPDVKEMAQKLLKTHFSGQPVTSVNPLTGPISFQTGPGDSPDDAKKAALLADIKKIFPNHDAALEKMSLPELQQQVESWKKYLPEHSGFASQAPQLDQLYDTHFGEGAAQQGPPAADTASPGTGQGLTKDILLDAFGQQHASWADSWMKKDPAAAKAQIEKNISDDSMGTSTKKKWQKVYDAAYGTAQPGAAPTGGGKPVEQAIKDGDVLADLSKIEGGWAPTLLSGDAKPANVQDIITKNMQAHSGTAKEKAFKAVLDKYFGGGAAQAAPAAKPAPLSAKEDYPPLEWIKKHWPNVTEPGSTLDSEEKIKDWWGDGEGSSSGVSSAIGEAWQKDQFGDKAQHQKGAPVAAPQIPANAEQLGQLYDIVNPVELWDGHKKQWVDQVLKKHDVGKYLGQVYPGSLKKWQNQYGSGVIGQGKPTGKLTPDILMKYFPDNGQDWYKNWVNDPQAKGQIENILSSDWAMEDNKAKWQKIYDEVWGSGTSPADSSSFVDAMGVPFDVSKGPSYEQLKAWVSAGPQSNLPVSESTLKQWSQHPSTFWSSYQHVKGVLDQQGEEKFTSPGQYPETHAWNKILTGLGVLGPKASGITQEQWEAALPGNINKHLDAFEMYLQGVSPAKQKEQLELWASGKANSGGKVKSGIQEAAKKLLQQMSSPSASKPAYDPATFGAEFKAILPDSKSSVAAGSADEAKAKSKVEELITAFPGSPQTVKLVKLHDKYWGDLGGQSPSGGMYTPEPEPEPEPVIPTKPFKSEDLNPEDLANWTEHKPQTPQEWKQFSAWWGATKIAPEQEQALFKTWFGKDATPEQANGWFSQLFGLQAQPSEGDLGLESAPTWATNGWALGKDAQKEWPVFAAWATKDPGLPKGTTIKQKMAIWKSLSPEQKTQFAGDYFPQNPVDTNAVVNALQQAFPESNFDNWKNLTQGKLHNSVEALAKAGYGPAVPIFNKYFGGDMEMPPENKEPEKNVAVEPTYHFPIVPEEKMPEWAKGGYQSLGTGKHGQLQYSAYKRWAESINKNPELGQFNSHWKALPAYLRQQIMQMKDLPWHDYSEFKEWLKTQPRPVDDLKKIVGDVPGYIWNQDPAGGYESNQRYDLLSRIKSETDPAKKAALTQVLHKWFAPGRPTLAETLKGIDPKPPELKGQDWDTWLKGHTVAEATAMLKKKIKNESDPEKWIQYVAAWPKYFGGPAGHKQVSAELGKAPQGYADPQSLRKMVYWKKHGKPTDTKNDIYWYNWENSHKESPGLQKILEQGDQKEWTPPYLGWTPPDAGGAVFKADPSFYGQQGPPTKYTVPSISETQSPEYTMLQQVFDSQNKDVPYSAKDKALFTSDVFRNWFNATPKDYQKVYQDHPTIALDDFENFMAGGQMHGDWPGMDQPSPQGKPKYIDTTPFALVPKKNTKDVSGKPIPISQTHNPPRDSGDGKVKFPQYSDEGQETLPLTPGEHFAPKYAPMPIYRLIPRSVINLDADPKYFGTSGTKMTQKDKEAFLQRQRWRLRQIDQILHGTPQRNPTKDWKSLQDWAKTNNLPPESVKDIADDFFASQPVLNEDEKWKYLQSFAKENKLPESAMYDLANKLGVGNPGQQVPGQKGNWDDPRLGPLILDYVEGAGGIGTHWTRDVEKAYNGISAAGIPNSEMISDGRQIPVLVSGLWAGQGEGKDGQGGNFGVWDDREREHTLEPGAPVHVRRLQIRDPQGDWHDLMDYGPISQWPPGRNESVKANAMPDKPSLAKNLSKDLGGTFDPKEWDSLQPGPGTDAKFAELLHKYDGNKEKQERILHWWKRFFQGRPDLEMKPHVRRASVERIYDPDAIAIRTLMAANEGVSLKYMPPNEHGEGAVFAVHQGRDVGTLDWGKDGTIGVVWVHPEHRNRGIATQMLELARQHHPEIHHSEILTPTGRGWSSKHAAEMIAILQLQQSFEEV